LQEILELRVNQDIDLSEINVQEKKKVDGLFSMQVSFRDIFGNDPPTKTKTTQ